MWAKRLAAVQSVHGSSVVSSVVGCGVPTGSRPRALTSAWAISDPPS